MRAPGSFVGTLLVVTDPVAARDGLPGRGVDTSEKRTSRGAGFIFFADPDGNRWAVQEIQRPA